MCRVLSARPEIASFWLTALTILAVSGCTEVPTEAPDGVTEVDEPRLLVPLELTKRWDDSIEINLAGMEGENTAPGNVLTAIENAASDWNSDLLEDYPVLPRFTGPALDSGVISRPRIIVEYDDDLYSGSGPFGYCGASPSYSFVNTDTTEATIAISQRDTADFCGGRIVNDLEGVIKHEMSQVLGLPQVGNDETLWCIANPQDTGGLNDKPCTWEVQVLYHGYDIRPSVPDAAELIVKRLHIQAAADTVSDADTITLSAYSYAGPEPSQSPVDSTRVLAAGAVWSVDDSNVVEIISQTDSTVTLTAGTAQDVTYLTVVAEPDSNVAYPWPRDSIPIVNLSGVASDFAVEWTNTWRRTDQYLNAAAGETGSNIRYRWKFDGGPWTAYSADTLYDFPGFWNAGNHTITLETKDLSTGNTAESTDTVAVSSDRLTMSGPSYVTDKFLKTYSANYVSDWWERYSPAPPNWTFYRTLPSDPQYPGDDEYNRIWAAGEYTVALRNQMESDNGRGRIDVEVCHESIPGCGGAEVLRAGDDWGDALPVFGGGPWLARGQELIRLYELTGLHAGNGPFAATDWLSPGSSGTYTSPRGVWQLEWETTGEGDYREVAFDAAIRGSGPFNFGISIDPDVGHSPADDRSAFDAGSGIVTVYDSGEAVAIALRAGETDALFGVKQYGVRERAPRASDGFLQRSRVPGASTRNEPDDVQLILTAHEVTGSGSWRLAMYRAPTLEEARQRLIELLDR